ncbi:MAG: hypothetical protein AB1730_23405 [Myxococcota bacterium]
MQVAFVTDELYPFSPGGIGRLVHNLVQASVAADPAIEIALLVPGVRPPPERVRALFGPRVNVHSFSNAPRTRATCAAHAAGLGARDRLIELEQATGGFDVIEFHDFRGLAFPSIQTKGLGVALRDSWIRVRIHGPASLIGWLEGEPVTPEMLAVFELERASLAQADEVVGPARTVINALADFFWLGPSWRQAARVEFPPAVWPAPTEQPTVPPASPRDLVFPTKLQRIKRPDLFIRAAVGVMRARPHWMGRARLLVPLGQSPLEAKLRALVPGELAHRFVFETADEAERRRAFRGHVVVVPSEFETSSLAAWEAAMMGAQLVVNTRCPAFAVGTPLAEWGGCHRFDGGARGLMAAMQRALDAEPAAPPAVEVTVHWGSQPVDRKTGPRLRCALVTTSRKVPRAEDFSEVEERWCTGASAHAPGWRVLPVLPGASDAEVWRTAAARTDCELVALLGEGELLPPGFLARAIDALSRNTKYAGVVCDLEVDGERRSALGATLAAGWVAPVNAGPGVFRTDVVLSHLGVEGSREALLLALGLEARTVLVDSQAARVPAGHTPLPVMAGAGQPGLHPMALRAVAGRELPLRYRLADRVDRLVRRVSPGLRERVRRFFSD